MAKKSKKKVVKKTKAHDGAEVETEVEVDVDEHGNEVAEDLAVETEVNEAAANADQADTLVEGDKEAGSNFKPDLSAKPTFKEAKGSEANQAAKAQAQADAKKKAAAALAQHPTIYSIKGDKVVKLVMKEDRVIQSYIGNMTRNKTELDAAIANWKKAGVWVESHMIDEVYRQAKLHLKSKAKA